MAVVWTDPRCADLDRRCEDRQPRGPYEKRAIRVACPHCGGATHARGRSPWTGALRWYCPPCKRMATTNEVGRRILRRQQPSAQLLAELRAQRAAGLSLRQIGARYGKSRTWALDNLRVNATPA